MAEEVTFYCLRCQSRFPLMVEAKEVKERTCLECGSNSVRKETPAAAEVRDGAMRIRSNR
ncbi:MAG: hypothetical protein ABIK65_07360 [Candidatus Eisenbacteria bacterium]